MQGGLAERERMDNGAALPEHYEQVAAAAEALRHGLRSAVQHKAGVAAQVLPESSADVADVELDGRQGGNRVVRARPHAHLRDGDLACKVDPHPRVLTGHNHSISNSSSNNKDNHNSRSIVNNNEY